MKDLDFFIEKTFDMIIEHLSNLKKYEDACIIYYSEIEVESSMFFKTISDDDYFLIKVFDKENRIGIYANKNNLFNFYREMVAAGLHSFYKIYNSRKGLKSNSEFIEETIEEIGLDFLSEINSEIENGDSIKILLLSFN